MVKNGNISGDSSPTYTSFRGRGPLAESKMEWWELDTYMTYCTILKRQERDIKEIGISQKVLDYIRDRKSLIENALRTSLKLKGLKYCGDTVQLYIDVENIPCIKEIDNTSMISNLVSDIKSNENCVKIRRCLTHIIRAYGMSGGVAKRKELEAKLKEVVENC